MPPGRLELNQEIFALHFDFLGWRPRSLVQPELPVFLDLLSKQPVPVGPAVLVFILAGVEGVRPSRGRTRSAPLLVLGPLLGVARLDLVDFVLQLHHHELHEIVAGAGQQFHPPFQLGLRLGAEDVGSAGPPLRVEHQLKNRAGSK